MTQLFTLGMITMVKKQSTIGDEKKHNPRLAGKTMDDFVAIMDNLNLPKPKLIDQAVPANLSLGMVSHAAE